MPKTTELGPLSDYNHVHILGDKLGDRIVKNYLFLKKCILFGLSLAYIYACVPCEFLVPLVARREHPMP